MGARAERQRCEQEKRCSRTRGRAARFRLEEDGARCRCEHASHRGRDRKETGAWVVLPPQRRMRSLARSDWLDGRKRTPDGAEPAAEADGARPRAHPSGLDVVFGAACWTWGVSCLPLLSLLLHTPLWLPHTSSHRASSPSRASSVRSCALLSRLALHANFPRHSPRLRRRYRHWCVLSGKGKNAARPRS